MKNQTKKKGKDQRVERERMKLAAMKPQLDHIYSYNPSLQEFLSSCTPLVVKKKTINTLFKILNPEEKRVLLNHETQNSEIFKGYITLYWGIIEGIISKTKFYSRSCMRHTNLNTLPMAVRSLFNDQELSYASVYENDGTYYVIIFHHAPLNGKARKRTPENRIKGVYQYSSDFITEVSMSDATANRSISESANSTPQIDDICFEDETFLTFEF